MLSQAELDTLGARAADSVALAVHFGLAEPAPIAPRNQALRANGATFVTLRQGSVLRGCVGSVTDVRSLFEDVTANARAAAFRDPRFEPLSSPELPRTALQVAVVGDRSSLGLDDWSDLPSQIRPFRDGLLLEHNGTHSAFLPDVWEQFPTPGEFVNQLLHKANLSDATPVDAVRIDRFQTSVSAQIALDRDVRARRDLRARVHRARWRVAHGVRRVVRQAIANRR